MDWILITIELNHIFKQILDKCKSYISTFNIVFHSYIFKLIS